MKKKRIFLCGIHQRHLKDATLTHFEERAREKSRGSLVMDKAGVSGVISILIIIALVLVAIGVVWVVVQNILSESSENVEKGSLDILTKIKSTGLSFASCKDILDQGYSTGDDVYLIDPLGNGNKFEVYCDMTTDGGGWTLVAICKPEDNLNYPSYNSGVPNSKCWNTNAVGIILNPSSSTTTKLSDEIIKIILSKGDKITRANWKQTYRYNSNNPTNRMVYNLLSDPSQWSSSGCGSQGKEFYLKYNYGDSWGSPLYSESTGCSCAVNGWSNTQKDSCGSLGTWIAGCEKAPSASHCCACQTYDERADIILYIR